MDIAGIGELLIDFTPADHDGERFFKQNAGGAPCNMLTMARMMGSETAFIGKVGDDQFGRFLKTTLEEKGVSTAGLVLSKEYHTTLAFVHLDEHGDRDFSFYRKGCADVMLTAEEIPYELLDSAKVLHFGSLSFTNEPGRSAVLEAVKYAKGKGKLITYDPNYRPPLWNSEAEAVEAMKMGFRYADIVKVSDEEALLLTDETELHTAGQRIMEMGVRLVCITLGAEGSFYCHPKGYGTVKGFRSRVVDTTGAGDSFFGSLVHQVLQHGCPVSELEEETLQRFLRVSNAVASLCIEGLGGIPSMPTPEQIEERLKTEVE